MLQEVDAIIVDPLDREGIKPALQVAGEAGIPIITCGNEVDTEWNHCAIYNDVYDVGCITNIVCSLIGGEGKVACVVGAPAPRFRTRARRALRILWQTIPTSRRSCCPPTGMRPLRSSW